MRTTPSLLLCTALLGACVDPPAASSRTSAASSSDPTDDGTTTVFVTIEGNPTPVFVAYRDGVGGPWRTPTANPGGVSYALQVHDAYEVVAVCLDGAPFPGFDAESLYATASDGGQSVSCGFESISIGGGGGGSGTPPPPPTLTGTIAQPGFVNIGPFNAFSLQPSWSFTDNFIVTPLSDLIATDATSIDIVRDIKTPADGSANSLGTIDIDKDGLPFATYTATTNPMDADESAQVTLLLQTVNGTRNETGSVASLASQVVPPKLVGALDAQEVQVEAVGPEFTAANGFLFPDLRSATALRIGNTDPLPTRFDLLERVFPAWARDTAGVVADLRAQPTRADTIELAIQNTQMTDGLITEQDIQNVVATPAFLAAAGTRLGFDTSAPGYHPSWVVAATTTQDGQVVPNPATVLVSWVDPDTGTLFVNENDMPEPGEQAWPPPFAAAARAEVVQHARDRFKPAVAPAIAAPN